MAAAGTAVNCIETSKTDISRTFDRFGQPDASHGSPAPADDSGLRPFGGLSSPERSTIDPTTRDIPSAQGERQIFSCPSKDLARTVRPAKVARLEDPSFNVDAEVLVNASQGEVVEYDPNGLIGG